MARIVFVVDAEEGHVFPTLMLAQMLLERRHDVTYVGPEDARKLIPTQRFQFFPVLQEILPQGSHHRRGNVSDSHVREEYFSALLRGNLLRSAFERARPDIVLILSHLAIAAVIIQWRYRVPIVLLRPYLAEGPRSEVALYQLKEILEFQSGTSEWSRFFAESPFGIRSLNQFASHIAGLMELALVPRCFETPSLPNDPATVYIGTSVASDRGQPALTRLGVTPGRPLVFCSLGSQSHLRRDTSRRLFRTVLRALRDQTQWHLVLSIGQGFDAGEFQCDGPNIMVVNWVPQLEVLSITDVMITHCGIGTVKECVLNRVPMLGVPLMRDQFRCAERLVHHGLGVCFDIETVTPEQIRAEIGRIMQDSGIRQRILDMREHLVDQDQALSGVLILERAAMTGLGALTSA